MVIERVVVPLGEQDKHRAADWRVSVNRFARGRGKEGE